jgi:hypothetical protein
MGEARGTTMANVKAAIDTGVSFALKFFVSAAFRGKDE